MSKKIDKKKSKKDEIIVTDIAREYFTEEGIHMVKITKLNGNKVVGEVIMPSSEDKAE